MSKADKISGIDGNPFPFVEGIDRIYLNFACRPCSATRTSLGSWSPSAALRLLALVAPMSRRFVAALEGYADFGCAEGVVFSARRKRYAAPVHFVAGLVPERARRLGLTLVSNRRARRVLVEAAWSYRHPARVSEALRVRLEGLPKTICDIAWKAQVRREMSALLWAIGRQVMSAPVA